MGLTRKEKVRRLRDIHYEISGSRRNINPICTLYKTIYGGYIYDDIRKFRYFKPVRLQKRDYWFYNDSERLMALNDLIDMYTGYYRPTLKERLRNIVRYILFHF